ncbi:MAG: hypothetical protein PSV40_01955 [Polaromonas sp.]|nr:hypothetical protein [Polaromonas sp.]MDI1267853.1 hypothetical protein [Polaromonas sp.]
MPHHFGGDIGLTSGFPSVERPANIQLILVLIPFQRRSNQGIRHI